MASHCLRLEGWGGGRGRCFDEASWPRSHVSACCRQKLKARLPGRIAATATCTSVDDTVCCRLMGKKAALRVKRGRGGRERCVELAKKPKRRPNQLFHLFPPPKNRPKPTFSPLPTPAERRRPHDQLLDQFTLDVFRVVPGPNLRCVARVLPLNGKHTAHKGAGCDHQNVLS